MMKNKIAILITTTAILCATASSLFLNGCNNSEKIEENTSEIPYTDFVGDNSAVSEIVSYMALPDGYEVHHIELETSEKPYGLSVYLTGEESIDYGIFNDNAELAFLHIKNLDVISFIKESTGDILAAFSR